MPEDQPGFVHYLPIATTLLSVAFLVAISARAIPRKWPPHLLWWAIGVFFYGLGTALESSVTLFGNTEILNRLWYWAGAILGGYPLATGTVYLLMDRGRANLLTAISMVLVLTGTVAVLFITPIDGSVIAANPHRPLGDAIGMGWVRLLTPFINGYAALFLVGGAIYSSAKFASFGTQGRRALGTASIAFGGILPGIGGGMAKAGVVEALYVGELVGLAFIWIGFHLCVTAPRFTPATETPRAESEASTAPRTAPA